MSVTNLKMNVVFTLYYIVQFDIIAHGIHVRGIIHFYNIISIQVGIIAIKYLLSNTIIYGTSVAEIYRWYRENAPQGIYFENQHNKVQPYYRTKNKQELGLFVFSWSMCSKSNNLLNKYNIPLNTSPTNVETLDNLSVYI